MKRSRPSFSLWSLSFLIKMPRCGVISSIKALYGNIPGFWDLKKKKKETPVPEQRQIPAASASPRSLALLSEHLIH